MIEVNGQTWIAREARPGELLKCNPCGRGIYSGEPAFMMLDLTLTRAVGTCCIKCVPVNVKIEMKAKSVIL